MSKLVELRERIRSVENIQRITRTLATVAAARLSRIRRRAAGLRDYAAAYREILANQHRRLLEVPSGAESDLLRPRAPVRRVAFLVVTADRGMCGGYNLEVLRQATALWQRALAGGQGVEFVVIGQKGLAYLTRRRATIVHHERWRRTGVTADDVERLLDLLVTRYRSGDVDAVHVVYTEFRSAVRRLPRSIQLLPVEPYDMQRDDLAAREAPWKYEPNAELALEGLVRIHLRVQLFGALLAAHASEQGARMVTMEEASERAVKALQGYRVQRHRLRREGITIDLLGSLFASRASRSAAAAAVRHE